MLSWIRLYRCLLEGKEPVFFNLFSQLGRLLGEVGTHVQHGVEILDQILDLLRLRGARNVMLHLRRRISKGRFEGVWIHETHAGQQVRQPTGIPRSLPSAQPMTSPSPLRLSRLLFFRSFLHSFFLPLSLFLRSLSLSKAKLDSKRTTTTTTTRPTGT